jgi:hypothetical protein
MLDCLEKLKDLRAWRLFVTFFRIFVADVYTSIADQSRQCGCARLDGEYTDSLVRLTG